MSCDSISPFSDLHVLAPIFDSTTTESVPLVDLLASIFDLTPTESALSLVSVITPTESVTSSVSILTSSVLDSCCVSSEGSDELSPADCVILLILKWSRTEASNDDKSLGFRMALMLSLFF